MPSGQASPHCPLDSHEVRVHYTRMTTRNITFSANPILIEQARERARKEKRTLNDAFRDWLQNYAAKRTTADHYSRLMKKMNYVRMGGPFTREELNER